MKKIVLLILTLLLIPFFIVTISTIDREEVNPTLEDLTLTETETHNSITDLNNHTLKEVFAEGNLVLNGDFSIDSNSDGLADNWSVGSNVLNKSIVNTYQTWTGDDNTFDNRLYQNNLGLETNNLYYVNFLTNNVLLAVLDGYDYFLIQPTNDFWVSTDIGYNSNIVKRGSSNNGNGIAFYPEIVIYQGSVKNVNMIDLTHYGIDNLTVSQMDFWYNVYNTYGVTYDYIQFGTATAGDYLLLQQLIIDNDSKEFKLYRDGVVDEVRYVMTQNVDNIVVSDIDGNELFILYSDDTYVSRSSLSDTTLSFVGYNVTSYIDGSFDNTILAFVWIIPILLIGGFFFVIFSHRKED